MKEKEEKPDKENFVSMVMLTTDMLEDPNKFYKDMAALSAVTKENKKKSE